MKQQKLSGYKPNYPKKALKGLTLAAAALMTIGTSAGCKAWQPQTTGIVPMDDPASGVEQTLPPEDVRLEGYIAYEPVPPVTPGAPLPDITPEPEDLRTGGVAMPEETPEPEEIELMGDVAIIDEP